MKEQHFSNPVQRRESFWQSLERLRQARQTIGTAAYTQRPDFNAENYSGAENLLVKVRVAEIKRQIDLKIPQVEEKVREFDQMAQEALRLTELSQKLPRIEELVREGYLEEEDLIQARGLVGKPSEECAKVEIKEGEKEEEIIILPDGQDISNLLTPYEKRVVRGLLCGSSETPVSS